MQHEHGFPNETTRRINSASMRWLVHSLANLNSSTPLSRRQRSINHQTPQPPKFPPKRKVLPASISYRHVFKLTIVKTSVVIVHPEHTPTTVSAPASKRRRTENTMDSRPKPNSRTIRIWDIKDSTTKEQLEEVLNGLTYPGTSTAGGQDYGNVLALSLEKRPGAKKRPNCDSNFQLHA
jgi:hypothetical protein